MFKMLKNIVQNNFIVTSTTRVVTSPRCPSSLTTHRTPDIDHSLQYRTTNFQNLPNGTQDGDKRRRPRINSFNYNPDCESFKRLDSPFPTEKMFLERKLQKQHILPNCFSTSSKIKEEYVFKDSSQKRVSSNDLLLYCIESSITSPKRSQHYSQVQFKYPLHPLSLNSFPDSSPRKILPDFPKDYTPPQKSDVPVQSPCPPWRTPIFPGPATCAQPCDNKENLRLLKLPPCPPSPSECSQPRPPPPLCNKYYTQACEGALPPIYSPSLMHSGSQARPEPCEFLILILTSSDLCKFLIWLGKIKKDVFSTYANVYFI